MQKGKVINGANANGTVNDETVYIPAQWNDNMFNMFTFVESAGYTLLDDDLSQITKASKGMYNATFEYNTSAIPEQTVNDIVRGSDGKYYEAQADGFSGYDPVGSVSGNWKVVPFDKGYSDNKLFAIATGTANAITATIPAITEYAENSTFRLKATATNTGATTINLNGLGVKNVVIDNVALVGGEIVLGSEYFFTYSSNGNFELTSLGGASTSGVTQTAYTQLITSGTSSATIPYDTSVPQQTEGVEILTCSITPSSATSNLLITVRTFVSETVNTGNRITGALFRDATLDAIASSMAPNNETAISAGEIVLQIRVPSNSTAPTTFKLRVGNDVGDVRWNGYLGVQYYGNTNITSIHIQEEN